MLRIVALALVTLAAGCTAVETRSQRLSPAFVDLHITRASEVTGPTDPFFLDRRGAATIAELTQWRDGGGLAQGVLVGFSADVQRGAQPAPNDLWGWSVYQGKVFFDLGPLPDTAIVRSATLSVTSRTAITDVTRFPSRDGDSYGCDLVAGSATVGIAAGETTGSGRDGLIPVRPARPDGVVTREMDITRTVFDWQSGRRPNLGLVISPQSDLLFVRDDTRYCAKYVSVPVLTVIYDVPVTP